MGKRIIKNSRFDFRNKIAKVTVDKKNKSYKDASRKLTRNDLAEVGKIADNGNYYLNYNIPWYYKILWFIDGAITSLLYLITAISLGFLLDKYGSKKLNKKDSKVIIFFQACGETLYMILLFFFIIYFYGTYLPNFSFYAPPEHTFLKNYSAGFFIIFGLFALDPKLKDKFKYVYFGNDYLTKNTTT